MMNTLSYPLAQGYIQNWLVTGQVEPDNDAVTIDTSQQPAENAPIDGTDLQWCYHRCKDDHLVDLTTAGVSTAWAYCQLDGMSSEAAIKLTTHGPVQVWLNGDCIHTQEIATQGADLTLNLQDGSNDLWVRVEYLQAFSLKVDNAAPQLNVMLPTSIKRVERREKFERVFPQATVDRDVFVENEKIEVRWPDDLTEKCNVMVHLRHDSGRIYAESRKMIDEETYNAGLNTALSVADGSYQARITPPPDEFYGGTQYEHAIDFEVLKGIYSTALYGTDDSRKQQVLLDASQRDPNVFSEMAKMALGQWETAKPETLLTAIEGINQQTDGHLHDLIGLVSMAYRYDDQGAYPEGITEPLQDCLLAYPYSSIADTLLRSTAQLLAGQCLSDVIFAGGETGEQMCQSAETAMLTWLHTYGTGKLVLNDSPQALESTIIALVHLVDFADADAIAELAAVALDKVLFGLAINSYQGAYGIAHPTHNSAAPLNARLGATAGITRMLWGQGVFNKHISASVSLACAVAYSAPSLVQAIGLHQPDALWSRESHGKAQDTIHKALYKTPDTMLSARQNAAIDAGGTAWHLWQATLSPDAIVFTNHPTHAAERPWHPRGYWRGSNARTRVAQWQDAVIAQYQLPADDWAGFTHAFFPLWAFDEYAFQGNWAFARKDDGYLALHATQGFTLMQQGIGAYRELRSYGQSSAWVCQMGRAAIDGNFETFKNRVRQLDINVDNEAIHCQTLHHGMLSLGWNTPLQVNGEVPTESAFTHYDSPHCQSNLGETVMDIRYDEYVMRLDFSIT